MADNIIRATDGKLKKAMSADTLTSWEQVNYQFTGRKLRRLNKAFDKWESRQAKKRGGRK